MSQTPVLLCLAALAFTAPPAMKRQPDGDPAIAITGMLTEPDANDWTR